MSEGRAPKCQKVGADDLTHFMIQTGKLRLTEKGVTNV